MIVAIECKSCDELEAVFKRANEDGLSIKNIINSVNENGWTALHFACVNPDIKVIELLLREGADVSMRTTKKYRSAFGDLEVFEGSTAKAIIERAIDARRELGFSPLEEDIRQDEEESLKLSAIKDLLEQCPSNSVQEILDLDQISVTGENKKEGGKDV